MLRPSKSLMAALEPRAAGVFLTKLREIRLHPLEPLLSATLSPLMSSFRSFAGKSDSAQVFGINDQPASIFSVFTGTEGTLCCFTAGYCLHGLFFFFFLIRRTFQCVGLPFGGYFNKLRFGSLSKTTVPGKKKNHSTAQALSSLVI